MEPSRTLMEEYIRGFRAYLSPLDFPEFFSSQTNPLGNSSVYREWTFIGYERFFKSRSDDIVLNWFVLYWKWVETTQPRYNTVLTTGRRLYPGAMIRFSGMTYYMSNVFQIKYLTRYNTIMSRVTSLTQTQTAFPGKDNFSPIPITYGGIFGPMS